MKLNSIASKIVIIQPESIRGFLLTRVEFAVSDFKIIEFLYK